MGPGPADRPGATTSRRRPAPADGRRSPPPPWRHSSPATRPRSAVAGWPTSTTCWPAAPRRVEGDAGLRRRPALAVAAPLRRRVPGRQPAPVPAPVRLARGERRPLRGRRPAPGHLRLERRRSRPAAPLPAALAGRHRHPPGHQPPLQSPGGGRRRGRPRPFRLGAALTPPRRSRPRRSVPTRPIRPKPRVWPPSLRRAHAEGLRWSQMAVLMRTNAQAAAFEAALRAAKVPYQLASGAGLLAHRAVRDVLAQLRRPAADARSRSPSPTSGPMAAGDDPAAIRRPGRRPGSPSTACWGWPVRTKGWTTGPRPRASSPGCAP